MKKGISHTAFFLIALVIGILLVVLFMGVSGFHLGTITGTSKKNICYQKFIDEYCRPWKNAYYSIQNKPGILNEKMKELASPKSECYRYFNDTFAGTSDFIVNITNDEATRQLCRSELGGEMVE